MIQSINIVRDQIVSAMDTLQESANVARIAAYTDFTAYEVRNELNQMFFDGIVDCDHGYWSLVCE